MSSKRKRAGEEELEEENSATQAKNAAALAAFDAKKSGGKGEGKGKGKGKAKAKSQPSDSDSDSDSSVLDSEDEEGLKLNSDRMQHYLDSDDSDLEGADQLSYVEFAFTEPAPSMSISIRMLLRTYLPKFNAHELAELVAAQKAVGTVIRIQDEEDAYAFASVLNVHQHKDKGCIKQTREYILQRCPGDIKPKLQKLIDNEKKPLGLIVNERMLNIPHKLMYPLHKSLMDDIQWIAENEKDARVKKSFAFENYLIVTQKYKEKVKNTKDNQAGAKKLKKASEDTKDDSFFCKFEEESYEEQSLLSFSCPCETVTSGQPRFTTVLVVPASKIAAVLTHMSELQ